MCYGGGGGVQVLDLRANELTTIATDTFASAPNLSVILLDDNHIGRVEPHAFRGLRAVRLLSLTGNRITTVPSHAFASLAGHAHACRRQPTASPGTGQHSSTHTHTHTHTFNGPLSGTVRVSQYQKGETNLDFTEARDSEWQWHQLGHMQVCTSLQTDNHASTPPLCYLQAGCPSCRPTICVKALKETHRCSS